MIVKLLVLFFMMKQIYTKPNAAIEVAETEKYANVPETVTEVAVSAVNVSEVEVSEENANITVTVPEAAVAEKNTNVIKTVPEAAVAEKNTKETKTVPEAAVAEKNTKETKTAPEAAVAEKNTKETKTVPEAAVAEKITNETITDPEATVKTGTKSNNNTTVIAKNSTEIDTTTILTEFTTVTEKEEFTHDTGEFTTAAEKNITTEAVSRSIRPAENSGCYTADENNNDAKCKDKKYLGEQCSTINDCEIEGFLQKFLACSETCQCNDCRMGINTKEACLYSLGHYSFGRCICPNERPYYTSMICSNKPLWRRYDKDDNKKKVRGIDEDNLAAVGRVKYDNKYYATQLPFLYEIRDRAGKKINESDADQLLCSNCRWVYHIHRELNASMLVRLHDNDDNTGICLAEAKEYHRVGIYSIAENVCKYFYHFAEVYTAHFYFLTV